MKKSFFILLSLVLLIVAFFGGARFNQRQTGPETAGTGNRQILHYVDPMNPAHTTLEPGIAPCGMPMEPVYADEDVPGGGARSNAPGAVPVSPHKQQVLGVHIDEVTRTTETLTFRALGRLVVDENRVFVVRAATEGWGRDQRQHHGQPGQDSFLAIPGRGLAGGKCYKKNPPKKNCRLRPYPGSDKG